MAFDDTLLKQSVCPFTVFNNKIIIAATNNGIKFANIGRLQCAKINCRFRCADSPSKTLKVEKVDHKIPGALEKS